MADRFGGKSCNTTRAHTAGMPSEPHAKRGAENTTHRGAPETTTNHLQPPREVDTTVGIAGLAENMRV